MHFDKIGCIQAVLQFFSTFLFITAGRTALPRVLVGNQQPVRDLAGRTRHARRLPGAHDRLCAAAGADLEFSHSHWQQLAHLAGRRAALPVIAKCSCDGPECYLLDVIHRFVVQKSRFTHNRHFVKGYSLANWIRMDFVRNTAVSGTYVQ